MTAQLDKMIHINQEVTEAGHHVLEATGHMAKSRLGSEMVASCPRCQFVVAWEFVATMRAHLADCGQQRRKDEEEDSGAEVQIVEDTAGGHELRQLDVSRGRTGKNSYRYLSPSSPSPCSWVEGSIVSTT